MKRRYSITVDNLALTSYQDGEEAGNDEEWKFPEDLHGDIDENSEYEEHKTIDYSAQKNRTHELAAVCFTSYLVYQL